MPQLVSYFDALSRSLHPCAAQPNPKKKFSEVLGLSEDEVKFYEALIENKSAVHELSYEILKKMAQKLGDNLRKSVTMDWAVRESVR